MAWRGRTPNTWSLDHPDDFLWLGLGTAIGLGNHFAVPSWALYSAGPSVLLVHVLSLLLLGVPLLIAEVVWGRWLIRPYTQSFAAVEPRLAWAPFVTIAALIFITPPYFVEIGRVFVLTMETFLRGGIPEGGRRREIAQSVGLSFAGAWIMLSVCAAFSARSVRTMTGHMKRLMLFVIPAWGLICLRITSAWQGQGLGQALLRRHGALTPDVVYRVCAFSLFSLSAGLGIFFTYAVYGSQVPLNADAREDNFWRRPSGLIRLVAGITAGDILASLVSLVWISPYALYGNAAEHLSSVDLILDWVPQLLVNESGGRFWVLLHHTSLLAAGTAAALSLFDWAVFHVERGLTWTRPKAALHVWLFGTGLLVPTMLPSVMAWMERWGSGFLLPLSALLLTIGVGWSMPVSAQRQIFGRGFLLDRLFLIWRFSIRFLIPTFLGYLLFTTLQ